MPKGVEHVTGISVGFRATEVRLSVMPKGVEHTSAFEASSASAASATFSDAERR